MPHAQPLPNVSAPLPAWLLLVVVVLALGIFSATYFAYFALHEAHRVGSSLPLAVGLSSFFLLMYAVTYMGTSAATLLGRNVKAAGLAFVGSIAFFLLLLFLVLNTLGA